MTDAAPTAATTNKVIEFFGESTRDRSPDWLAVLQAQHCPYLGKRCFKVRKSDPARSIGTCSVLYGRRAQPIAICPARLLERQQVFVDSLHLLKNHEPGNELHVVSEVYVPGGSVDYFVTSVRGGKVRDFVGVEFQTLDTTGTVWPERQRLLLELGLTPEDDAAKFGKRFGMNWKMTAKTILVQMHHKVQTFEHINRKLVLVVQDVLLDYMAREFDFAHLAEPPLAGDAMHFHAYRMAPGADGDYRLELDRRFSTDADGIGRCLGLQAEARIEMAQVVQALERKLSSGTRLRVGS